VVRLEVRACPGVHKSGASRSRAPAAAPALQCGAIAGETVAVPGRVARNAVSDAGTAAGISARIRLPVRHETAMIAA
jgi:hypothetical protein